jgi:hypothetical protein
MSDCAPMGHADSCLSKSRVGSPKFLDVCDVVGWQTLANVGQPDHVLVCHGLIPQQA